MKRWIHRLKVWIIHKLGGYTADEATPNRKIQRLAMTHSYTTDMIRASVGEIHLRERNRALMKFVSNLEQYVTVVERRDYETAEWVLCLSMRVVDEHLL